MRGEQKLTLQRAFLHLGPAGEHAFERWPELIGHIDICFISTMISQ
jgi:hypothetical protein